MENKHPIVIEKVNKTFGLNHVLNDTSLKIKEGEIYGLVGLNGIGKTTIIKIILGLLNHDNGKVKIFGRNNSDQEAKKHFVYLPEKFTPSTYLKGKEFLDISLSFYKKKLNLAIAEEYCTKLEFNPKFLTKKVSNYSKGMGQKLGLVSIFLSGAKLLILDEPMSGLDPSARIALKDMLLDYKKKGNTIFFTSHILADIEEICDRIGVLNKGAIQYEGDVKKFIKTYKSENLERAFLNSISVNSKH
jgi:ABC-2 type transport system ATP-binding protein